MADSFLHLLYAEAPREAFDQVVADAERRGSAGADLASVRADYDVALRLRELIARQRSREAQLSALYETASDLTAIRDVDLILTAIVRRARQLLNADMTYLSLNDEGEGASYMKVTDGALTQEFRRLRLPLGTGLLGLVAQTGAPYFTEDYQSDERFVHRDYIDSAVDGEMIRAILGVPLVVDGRVTGALLAVHRTVRQFPPDEVSLLTSFAAHASVALENARLFERVEEAHRSMREHTAAVEAAANAHDQLTDLLLRGEGVAEVATAVSELLGGHVAVHDSFGELLAGQDGDLAPFADSIAASVSSGRCVEYADCHVAAALASGEHVATLVLRDRKAALGLPERRTLERAALVTALILVFDRSVADAEERLGGELLADLLDGREPDPVRRRERAGRQHADLEGPLALVVACLDEPGQQTAHRAGARFATGNRGLSARYRGTVVVLVPSADPGETGRAVHSLLGDGATSAVVAADVDTLPAAFAQARRCVEALLTLGRHGTVSDPVAMGVSGLLLGSPGADDLAAFVSATVGPLLEYDARRGSALVDTVLAWFAHGGHLRDTAAQLHVHPNTVAQRLERVGELLGPEWRDPARSLDLQLALRMHQLRDV
ncbi:helix-turn-helix domain-containing protein [Nocardioides sp.]|uniref:helix-turn-helix domain-containing protein n=1 Tax=Nocardioides sp. TaxID=35761 RepID=UPI003D0C9458